MGLGGGFANYQTYAGAPAGCDTCHRWVTVNAKLPPPHECPTAGCAGSASIIGDIVGPSWPTSGTVVFDWLVDGAADTRYVLREGPYTCPVCGESRLAFAMTGDWDR